MPQEPVTDVIPISNGNLELTCIAHGTLMMKYNDLVIHIDPVTMFNTDYSKLPKADIILVTHEHGDHLDTNAIKMIIKDNTVIIMNQASQRQAGFGEVMANGDSKTVMGITIDAVPAYNLNGPHIKGNGNGYVLQFGDKKVYVAGDTENIPEISYLKDIDIAFLPMNRPTMTPEMLAEAAKRIHPSIVYPYHYDKSQLNELVELMKDVKDIELRIKDLPVISMPSRNEAN